jgi:hypothetical protein
MSPIPDPDIEVFLKHIATIEKQLDTAMYALAHNPPDAREAVANSLQEVERLWRLLRAYQKHLSPDMVQRRLG